MKKELILFLHVPKTAGTSLAHSFRDAYAHSPSSLFIRGDGRDIGSPTRNKEIATRLVSKFNNSAEDCTICYFDHMYYGVHYHLPDDIDYKYICFVREPISRVISDYLYVHRTKEHILYPSISMMTIEQCIGSGIYKNAMSNLMTRYLSGKAGGEIEEPDLLAAKENLSNFAYVGRQENFHQCFKEMQDAGLLRHDTKAYREKFYVGAKPQVAYSTYNHLKALNHFDIQLYDWVCNK
mgnify:CR=1 FL=1